MHRGCLRALVTMFHGRKKEPKPKLFGPDIFGWGGGLPHEGVRAKKFGMSLETRDIKLFWRDIPGFCRDIPGVPEKFEKKLVCVQFWASNVCQLEYTMRFITIGRLIFIHLRCWEVLPFLIIQRQRCIRILCPKDSEFYTPLALNRQKGQHLPALEVYKNQSPNYYRMISELTTGLQIQT